MSNLHNLRWYKIPCSWEVYGTVEVAANSLDAAIEKVKDEDFPPHNPKSARFPSRSSYIDGSFEVDYDIAKDINDE